MVDDVASTGTLWSSDQHIYPRFRPYIAANLDARRVPPVDGMARLEAGGDIYDDEPVTIYSSKVAQGVYPNDNFFGTTSKAGPFTVCS